MLLAENQETDGCNTTVLRSVSLRSADCTQKLSDSLTARAPYMRTVQCAVCIGPLLLRCDAYAKEHPPLRYKILSRCFAAASFARLLHRNTSPDLPPVGIQRSAKPLAIEESRHSLEHSRLQRLSADRSAADLVTGTS